MIDFDEWSFLHVVQHQLLTWVIVYICLFGSNKVTLFGNIFKIETNFLFKKSNRIHKDILQHSYIKFTETVLQLFNYHKTLEHIFYSQRKENSDSFHGDKEFWNIWFGNMV